MELNIAWLGAFTECMDTVATKKQPDNSTKYLFKGQYCIAIFKPPGPAIPVRKIFDKKYTDKDESCQG